MSLQQSPEGVQGLDFCCWTVSLCMASLRSNPNSHLGIGGPVLCPLSLMQPQPPRCLPGTTCSCQVGSPDHPTAPQPALPSLCLPSLPQGTANACRSQKPNYRWPRLVPWLSPCLLLPLQPNRGSLRAGTGLSERDNIPIRDLGPRGTQHTAPSCTHRTSFQILGGAVSLQLCDLRLAPPSPGFNLLLYETGDVVNKRLMAPCYRS